MGQKDVSDILADTRRSLEEGFFAKVEAEKIAKLRAEQTRVDTREALKEISGIDNQDLLKNLLTLNISAETFSALTLTPLVEVAWADGELEQQERQAILRAASDSGMKPGSSAYTILESWLLEKPNPKLFGLWRQYVQELTKVTPIKTLTALREAILNRARNVAEAAGGFLGLGSRISKLEQETLRQLALAFETGATSKSLPITV